MLDIRLDCNLVHDTKNSSSNRSSNKSNGNKNNSFHKGPRRLVARKSCCMPHVMIELVGPVCTRLASAAVSWPSEAKDFTLVESDCKDSKSKHSKKNTDCNPRNASRCSC